MYFQNILVAVMYYLPSFIIIIRQYLPSHNIDWHITHFIFKNLILRCARKPEIKSRKAPMSLKHDALLTCLLKLTGLSLLTTLERGSLIVITESYSSRSAPRNIWRIHSGYKEIRHFFDLMFFTETFTEISYVQTRFLAKFKGRGPPYFHIEASSKASFIRAKVGFKCFSSLSLFTSSVI